MRFPRNLLLRLTAVTVLAVALLGGNVVAQNETSTTEAPAATPNEGTTGSPTQAPAAEATIVVDDGSGGATADGGGNATAPQVVCPFCPNGTHINAGWEGKIAGGFEIDGVCKKGYCSCAQAEEYYTTTPDPETGECQDASGLHGMCNCVSVDSGAGVLSVTTSVAAMAVGFLALWLGL